LWGTESREEGKLGYGDEDEDEDEEGGDLGRAAEGSLHYEMDGPAGGGDGSEHSSILPATIINHPPSRAVHIQDNTESEEVFHDAQSTILDDETDGAFLSAPGRARPRPANGQASSRRRGDMRAPNISPVLMPFTDTDSADSDRWSRGFYTSGGGYVRRLPTTRMRLDERGRFVFLSDEDERNGETGPRGDRNSSSRRQSRASESRRSGTSRQARVILSISPSVSGTESEEALAHRVAGLERDIFGEDDFVAQPRRRTRRHRSTHDDDEEEEAGDGLSSLEEASSGHSHSDGFLSDSDDHEHQGQVDEGHSSDSHDGEGIDER